MIRYLLFALISSNLVASANANLIGEGFCEDSQSTQYKVVAFIGLTDPETECPSSEFCGRPEVIGYEWSNSGGFRACNCLFDAFFTAATIPSDIFESSYYSASSSNLEREGSDPITTFTPFPGIFCHTNPLWDIASMQGDPTVVGLNGQTFKFDGRHGAWYSNLAAGTFNWNTQFQKFGLCPEEENMFVSAASFMVQEDNTRILIRTTEDVDPECYDPNKVCLGGGKLQLSFDGGKTFKVEAGDYQFGHGSRVIAHNTYGSCSRKWFDFEVSSGVEKQDTIRGGGRRVQNIEQKAAIEYVGSKKGSTLDPTKCDEWIKKRVDLDDLFKQNGFWSTIYIETPLISFHVEFRQQNPDKNEPSSCYFQSLDTWITSVSPTLVKESWRGVLGETRYAKHDSTGQKVLNDRFKILDGQKDSDYEVEGPFETKFAAQVGNTSMLPDFDLLMSRKLEQKSSF